MQRTLIRNVKSIVTCDPEDHVYYDTDMLIEGPQILKIGKIKAIFDIYFLYIIVILSNVVGIISIFKYFSYFIFKN